MPKIDDNHSQPNGKNNWICGVILGWLVAAACVEKTARLFMMVLWALKKRDSKQNLLALNTAIMLIIKTITTLFSSAIPTSFN